MVSRSSGLLATIRIIAPSSCLSSNEIFSIGKGFTFALFSTKKIVKEIAIITTKTKVKFIFLKIHVNPAEVLDDSSLFFSFFFFKYLFSTFGKEADYNF
jgi:hypothetical protein